MRVNEISGLKHNNKGFSLVELLVAVAILSIISISVMKSFSTAAITSSRAQSTQNATSIAEKVMEDIKSKSRDEIESFTAVVKTRVDSEGNNVAYNDYRYKLLNQTATSGEKFDVYVELTESGHNNDAGTTDTSDINSVKLPEIFTVNSDEHIVISWEMNSYDASAVENLAYKANVSKSDVKNNGKKTIIVDMTGGGASDIEAKCNVEYEYSGKKLEYNVFNKKVKDIPIDSKLKSGGPHLYLFYSPSNQINSTDYFAKEEIQIKDNTASPVSVSGETYKQDIYVIMQNPDTVINNPKIIVSGSNITGGQWETPSVINKTNSWEINSDVHSYLYTNLKGTNLELDSSLYKTEKKSRMYNVVVKVYKAGIYSDSDWPSDSDGKKKLAELNSSIRIQ